MSNTNQKEKELYAVRIIYKISIKGIPQNTDEFFDAKHTYFEESIIAVEGESFEKAEKRAIKLAKEKNTEYQNPYGQTVCYEFYKVIDSFVLTDTQDGDDLYSCTFKVKKEGDNDSIDERYKPLVRKEEMKMLFNAEYEKVIKKYC